LPPEHEAYDQATPPTSVAGRKQLNHAGLIGPLIEAVKELDTRLRAVEERLANKQES
jgi:hypothetical protein